MTEDVSRRSRLRSATAVSSAPATTGEVAGHFGARGFEVAQQEAKKAEIKREERMAQSRAPQRFYMKNDAQGKEGKVILILDRKIDDIFFMFEHQKYDAGSKSTTYVPCINETGICPICADVEAKAHNAEGSKSPWSPSTYTMFLSILDITPYTIQNGDRKGQVIEQTKKLLPIKATGIPDFGRILKAAENQHGTIRGLEMQMVRDGEFDARTGKPKILDNGSMFAYWPEAEFVVEFGHAERKVSDKLIIPANYDITPYDMKELFPKPTAQAIVDRLGVAMPDGTLSAAKSEWEAGDAGTEQPAQRTRTRTSAPGGTEQVHTPEQTTEQAPTEGTRSRTRRVTEAQDGEEEQEENPFFNPTTGVEDQIPV